ncbi:hypothetical protein [Chitinophaga cymbidii]|uniref:Uncharacterized protein n=1 Tax=Chitinophaga cymbidii TaxID=1096750 RepID=A0A512RPT3_9BACT|nr:hypothetical protein [Chitinophaga cymbidii]GEP97708.1 hypothetical protein CCY01nite_39680 [Chitinophaga cymbidii]
MYYIRKYADCWAVHDDITGASRKLINDEKERLKNEFDSLRDEKVLTIYSDCIRSLSVFGGNYQEGRALPSVSQGQIP